MNRLQQAAGVRPQGQSSLPTGLPFGLQVTLQDGLYLARRETLAGLQPLGESGHKAAQRGGAQVFEDAQVALQGSRSGVQLTLKGGQQHDRHQGTDHCLRFQTHYLLSPLVHCLADRLS